MSAVVGSAEFLVKIRDMVTGPMKSIGASVASSLKQIGAYAAGNLLADSIRSAVNQARSFIQSGIDTNAEFDKLNNSFTVMLGSQRKAAALMGDLQKFAAATPFEMQGLSKAASALLATKQIGQHDVIPMLRKLGDAAAASTEGFEAMPRVVRAISQMLSKGKLQAEEMMQLAEAGVPAWNILADKMKISSAQVQKLAQGGKLGVRQIHMLVDGLGEKFKGLAEKQSKTFSGLLSTLKDNAAMAAAEISRPIYDRLTKVMSGLSDGMNTNFFKTTTAQLAAAVQYVIDLYDKIAKSPLTKTVIEVAAIAAGFVAAGAALAWVPTLAGIAASLAPTVAAVSAIAAGVTGLAVLFRNAFSGPEGEILRAKLLDIWKLIKEIGLNTKEAIVPALSAAAGWVMRIFGGTSSLQRGFNGAVDSVLNFTKKILDVVSIISADFGGAWDFVQTKVAESASYIHDIMRHLLMEQLPNMMLALKESAFTAIDEIVLSIYELISANIEASGTIAQAAMAANKEIIGNLDKLFYELYVKAMAIPAEIVLHFKTAFKSLAEYIADVFTATYELIYNQAKHVAEAVKLLASANSRGAWNKFQEARLADPEKFQQRVGAAGLKLQNANAEFGNRMKGHFNDIGNILDKYIGASGKKFMAEVVAAGTKFAGRASTRINEAFEQVGGMFNLIRGWAPQFKKSDTTNTLGQMAGDLWNKMTAARDKRRGERDRADLFNAGMEHFGINKVIGMAKNLFKNPKEMPGQIGDWLGEMMADGAKGVFGLINDGLGIFRDDDKKKKKKPEFLGYTELNKRIQTALGKEDKNAKAQLKAQQKGAAAAEKGAAAGEKIAGLAQGIKDGIGKLFLGFGA